MLCKLYVCIMFQQQKKLVWCKTKKSGKNKEEKKYNLGTQSHHKALYEERKQQKMLCS
jgi:hypothetical protein